MELQTERPAFDPEATRPLLRALVHRKATLFDAFPDVCEDDLLQIAYEGALAAHKNYDPSRGDYAARIAAGAICDLIDYYRKRKRTADREARHIATLNIQNYEKSDDGPPLFAGHPSNP